ncbi:MAG: hypothetical protein ACQEQL_07190, partial [Pseudomonadota bacterium]
MNGFKKLCNEFATLNTQNKQWRLGNAIIAGKTDKAVDLIENGADPNTPAFRDSKLLPLEIAMTQDDGNMVGTLLKNGAKPKPHSMPDGQEISLSEYGKSIGCSAGVT